jgi:hypothetical protein
MCAAATKTLGRDDPGTLTNSSPIGYGRVGPGAIIDLARLVTDSVRLLGPEHPDTLNTRGSLATVRGGCGDVARAVAETEQLLRDRTRVLGPDHPDTRTCRENLAYWRARA